MMAIVRDDGATRLLAVEDRRVSVLGESIGYLAAGDSGPAIALAHGGGSSRWHWADLMGRLAARSRALAPDLIGFGDAPRRDDVHSIDYLAEFLAAFMEATGAGPAVLVGHSLGGRVCIEVALRNPQAVAGLVLIAPLGFGKLAKIGRLMNVSGWWLNWILKRRSLYPKLALDFEESAERFASLECETLLLWGDRDKYFPVRQSAQALKSIPNSELRVYERAGHAPHLALPDRFVSDTLEFARRVTQPGRR